MIIDIFTIAFAAMCLFALVVGCCDSPDSDD